MMHCDMIQTTWSEQAMPHLPRALAKRHCLHASILSGVSCYERLNSGPHPRAGSVWGGPTLLYEHFYLQ